MVNCEILRVSFAIWIWDPRLIISSGDFVGIHKGISFFFFWSCVALLFSSGLSILWLFSFPRDFLFCNL
jgi:hypothetical protein